MRSTRKRVGAAASVAVLALTLTAACSSGGGGTDEPSASSDGIPDAQRVGAMDDFEVGTEFVATEPVTFSVHVPRPPELPAERGLAVLLRARGEEQGRAST